MEKPINNSATRDAVRWYVLTTLSPQATEQRLEAENAARIAQNHPFGTIQYFIPYQFLKRRHAKGAGDSLSDGTPSIPRGQEDVRKNNQTRNALRRYIFLHAHESDLVEYLSGDWNRWGDNRVQFYLDRDRRKVTVPEQMMDKFIEACCDMQLHFELVPTLEGLSANEEVLLNTTPFRGEHARVLSIVHTPHGTRLTLGLNIFSGAMVLRLDDVRESDIIRHISPTDNCHTKADVPDSPAIDERHLTDTIQRRLLDILSRRVHGTQTDESRATDGESLADIYNYRYRLISQPAARRHFLALMLICAHLRKDKSGESELTAAAQSELAAIEARRSDKAATDVRAYLLAALYLSTGDAAYRDAAKTYIREHEPQSQPLRRLVKLIRVKRV